MKASHAIFFLVTYAILELAKQAFGVWGGIAFAFGIFIIICAFEAHDDEAP